MLRSALPLVLLLGCTAKDIDDPADSAEPSDSAADTGDGLLSCVDGETTVLDGVAYAKLCARTFDMGCTPGAGDCTEDEPLHAVTLTRDLWIAVTETTQADYSAAMSTNPAAFRDCGSDGSGSPICPLETINWHIAAAYANERSRSAGLETCYTCESPNGPPVCEVAVDPYACGGYRLPTEAEWEAAARCGQDLVYAGSDVIAEVGWTSETAGRSTHGVAQLAPNACGLYDMSGNVFEWTQDAYGPLNGGAATDPAGAGEAQMTYRVLRGGTWYSDASFARVSLRSFVYPDFSNYRVGFRLARTAP